MYELGNYIMRTAISAASEFTKIKPGFFINVNASSEQLEKMCIRDRPNSSVIKIIGQTHPLYNVKTSVL